MLKNFSEHLISPWEVAAEKPEDSVQRQPLMEPILEYLANLPDGETHFVADDYSIRITSSNGVYEILFCLPEGVECFELRIVLGEEIMFRRQTDEDVDWEKAIDMLAMRAHSAR